MPSSNQPRPGCTNVSSVGTLHLNQAPEEQVPCPAWHGSEESCSALEQLERAPYQQEHYPEVQGEG